MNELHSSVDFDDLLHHYKSSTRDKDFRDKDIFNMIKNKRISLSHAAENQEDVESKLGEIKVRGKKSSAQKR